MVPKPLKVQVTKEGNVQYNLFQLETFLADLDRPSVIEISVKNPRKPSRKVASKRFMAIKELSIKTVQLSKAYATEKKAHFKRPGKIQRITSKDREFKHLKKAIPIIERHKVTYKKYIKAQVWGLKWTNDGKGQFPTPSMLGTEAAETRLMEFIKDGNSVQYKLTSKKERETPLTDNHTYQAYAKKVKDQIATLDETLYVQELQLARKGLVRDWVKDHLKKVS